MINIPTECPSCASTLAIENDQLFCRNKECSQAVSSRIISHCKKQSIKGLGSASIAKLDVVSIPEIYHLEKEYITEILGEKVGTKVYEQISMAKNTTLQSFIGSLGIPLVGQTSAKNIVGTDLFDFDYSLLGVRAQEELEKWIIEESDDYKDIQFNFSIGSDIQNKLIVCITGKIEGYTKSKIEEELSEYITVSNTVTKNVNYLICEEHKNSAKEEKAESYNIPIITLSELKAITRRNK